MRSPWARKKDKKDPGGRYVLTLEASLTKAQYKQVDPKNRANVALHARYDLGSVGVQV